MTEVFISKVWREAVTAHKAGEISEADRLYTIILKAEPAHPDANHNMGILALGLGKLNTALTFFKKSLEAKPNTTQFWLSYINTLIKLERLTEAQTAFDQIKTKGAKGRGFDELEQKLSETAKKFVKYQSSTNVEVQHQPSILNTLTLDQALRLAKKKGKDGKVGEAKRIFESILSKFPNNGRAKEGM